MKDLINRVQQQLDENHPVEAEDIQALVDFAQERQWNDIRNKKPNIDKPYKGFIVWIADNDRKYISSGYATSVRFSREQERFIIEEDAIYKAFYGDNETVITHWMNCPKQPKQ